MKLQVTAHARGGCRWADEAVADWTRRLRRHGPITEERLKPVGFRGDVDAVRAAEATALLARVGPRDRLIALDERGADLDTDGFCDLLRSARSDSVYRLVFAIGGPYGHDDAVRTAAHRVIRLSSLVLNHEVARVVLFEQIYRASAILSGAPYHH